MIGTIKAALVAAGFGAALLAYEFTPLVGPRARVERVAEDRDAWREASGKWQIAAERWESSYRISQGLRASERVTARAAVNEMQASCEARVVEARRTARAIKEIVNAPVPNDDAGRPVRQLVDPGVLRDALGARASR